MLKEKKFSLFSSDRKDRLKSFWKTEKKTITAILAASVILVIFSGIAGIMDKTYIKEEGRVVGIRVDQSSVDKSGPIISVPLRVEAARDDAYISEDVIISIGACNSKEKGGLYRESAEEELSRMVSSIVDDVGKKDNLKKGKLILPDSLEDGTPLEWKEPNSLEFLLPLLPGILLILYLYSREEEKEKKRKEEIKNDVLKSLPDFTNQLILLLGSGLVFSDAYRRTAELYGQKRGESPFAEVIFNSINEADRTGRNPEDVLAEYAASLKIREFSRIVEVICDNIRSGVDFSEKLKEEGRFLWNVRKKNAEDQGKKAEIYLSFPLGILLGVLILIAGAPAVIQI